MANTLTAIANIIDSGCFTPTPKTTHCLQRNRVNAQGDKLEDYVLDAYANSFALDGVPRDNALQTVFSYLGNSSTPPDAMLLGGDALEVKKFEHISNDDLPLNSSYPKDVPHSNNPLLTETCKTCEQWTVKDMAYHIGFLDGNAVKRLWIAYGDCFCAKEAVYQTIASTITNGLNQIHGISLSPTKELARVNDVDSLGITNLRIRGMWTISSPNKLFENIVNYDETAQFQLFCVMTTKKYNSFPQNDRDNLIAKQGVNISVRVVPDPNNNAQNIGVTIISYNKA